MSEVREIQESPLHQGADELITYTLTTTPRGSSPTSVSVKAYDITNGARTDVSSTVLNGSPAISDDEITLPTVKSLTAGNVYRIEIKFDTASGDTLETYVIIHAEN